MGAKKEEEKKEGDDDAEKKEDEKKKEGEEATAMDTDTKEAEAEPKAAEKKTKVVKVKQLKETVEDTIELSADEARGAFKLLAGKNEDQTDKATFLRHVRTALKVIKPTAMTDGMSIKDAATTRRLEVHDVVEVLDGPRWCEESWVLRVKARIGDDEGFVTVSGNAGSVFLMNGGNQFRVLKPIELTDEFEAEKKETAADADAEKAGEDAEK